MRIFISIIIAGLFFAFSLNAENPILKQKIQEQREKKHTTTTAIDKISESLQDLNKLGLLSALPLGKDTSLIKKMQLKQGNLLFKEYDRLNKGRNKRDIATVEKFRNGEVLLITIPSSLLFYPNETTLTPNASKYLSPLVRFLKNPDMYWMVLDMHTDNTGSKEYTDSLALDRVDAVFEWFENNGSDTRFLFPTASGSTEPLPGNKNLSMESRARNRRLEVYLIPGNKMLDQAKKGRIGF